MGLEGGKPLEEGDIELRVSTGCVMKPLFFHCVPAEPFILGDENLQVEGYATLKTNKPKIKNKNKHNRKTTHTDLTTGNGLGREGKEES